MAVGRTVVMAVAAAGIAGADCMGLVLVGTWVRWYRLAVALVRRSRAFASAVVVGCRLRGIASAERVDCKLEAFAFVKGGLWDCMLWRPERRTRWVRDFEGRR